MYREFEALYQQGERPKVEEFNGKYRIMLAVPLLSFLFRDVKVIAQPPYWSVDNRPASYGSGDNTPTGINIAYGFIHWGEIFLQLLSDCVCLNYCRSRWPFCWIRDHIRRIGEYRGKGTIYIGEFRVRIRAREFLICYFTMLEGGR